MISTRDFAYELFSLLNFYEFFFLDLCMKLALDYFLYIAEITQHYLCPMLLSKTED